MWIRNISAGFRSSAKPINILDLLIMKHLIIYSHINDESFSHAILETVVAESKNKNAEFEVRDLTALNFNPLLSAADMESLNRGETPADIRAEQKFVEWADVISFIYPLWWGHMPAILKGYIDRVFAYDFAYSCKENGEPIGLLPGKKIMMFTPMGNPTELYEKMGMIKALELTTDTCIFEYCGITDIKHLHFGNISLVDDAARKEMLQQSAQLVSKTL